MTTRYKVYCKVHDSQQRVISVGIGSKTCTVDQVWDWINSVSHDYEFYTEDQYGKQAIVKTGTSTTGRKFLTTSPDSSIDNNLDELLTCM